MRLLPNHLAFHIKNSSWVLMGLLMMLATNVRAQKYAPTAEFSTQTMGGIDDNDVPMKDAVEIPPYPGAVIASLYSPAKDEQQGLLPYINLISADPIDKVMEFYKQELLQMDGWKWSEMMEFFYKGDDAMKAMSNQVPFVNIMEADPEAFDVIYITGDLKTNMKTRIQVVYKPTE